LSIEDWLPIKSNDPAVNAAIAVFLVMAAIILIVVGGMFLLPVVLILGIAKGLHWYMHRPTPTDQLYAQAQQRGITANFPDADKFMEAYLDRFLDAIRDDLPAYSIFLTMANISEALYKDEKLTNPLPPLGATNEIEEGRYRDQLVAYQRKTADAAHTLEVFNATLGKCYLDFIAGLPAIAKATPEQFAKCDHVEAFATFPLIDVLPEPAKLIWAVMLSFFREDVENSGCSLTSASSSTAISIMLPGRIIWRRHTSYSRPTSTRARRARSSPSISAIRRSRRCFMPLSPSRLPTNKDTSTPTSSAAPATARRSCCSGSSSTT
jgi:hypothetical protein